MAVDPNEVPLSPAQRSKIRRLSQPKEPAPGEEAGELNIVPYLDIIMNIIVFVIATISVVFVTTIDTNPPSAGGGKGTRMASKALNLTALITAEGISLKTSSGNIATGCSAIGSGITIPKKGNGDHDYTELTRCSRELKKQNDRFAEETQVTVTANPDVAFQVIISVMDAFREDKDGPLFPDVHFGVAR
ncbi:MAG: biopolymer transporter ExbD [Myxococcales bacterium]|nr:biopolymer transporter ExbD [Myxococcales bacterium]